MNNLRWISLSLHVLFSRPSLQALLNWIKIIAALGKAEGSAVCFTGIAPLWMPWYSNCLVCDKRAIFIHFRFLNCCTAPHLPNWLCLILSPCSWLYLPLCTTLLPSVLNYVLVFRHFLCHVRIIFDSNTILSCPCSSSQLGVICISDKDSHYSIIQWQDFCWTLPTPSLYFDKDTFLSTVFKLFL